MNKILYTSLLSVFLVTSCIPRNSNENKGDTTVEATGTASSKKEKPKYKADIKQELEGYFVHQKSGKNEQVMPKHVSANGYGIYCYFFLRNNKGISLKLHIQYADYDADLFELVADGETMEYEVNKIHQAEGNAMVVEGAVFQWYDKGINLSDEEFFRKIEDVEKVTLNFKQKKGDRLLGSKTLTKQEVQSLVQTIDYYKAWDGAKIPKKGMVNIRG